MSFWREFIYFIHIDEGEKIMRILVNDQDLIKDFRLNSFWMAKINFLRGEFWLHFLGIFSLFFFLCFRTKFINMKIPKSLKKTFLFDLFFFIKFRVDHKFPKAIHFLKCLSLMSFEGEIFILCPESKSELWNDIIKNDWTASWQTPWMASPIKIF